MESNGGENVGWKHFDISYELDGSITIFNLRNIVDNRALDKYVISQQEMDSRLQAIVGDIIYAWHNQGLSFIQLLSHN